MASPAAEAVAQANGLAAAAGPEPSPPPQSQLDDSATSTTTATTTTKRKRELSDDGEADADKAAGPTDAVATSNQQQQLRDEKSLIRDYYSILQRHDTVPSILKRPLPDPSSADEPQSKRQKSDDEVPKLRCIDDKVNQDVYQSLDQLVLDLKRAVNDRSAELQAAEPTDDGQAADESALVRLSSFKDKALELHSREMSYPHHAAPALATPFDNYDELAQKPTVENAVLTVFGQAPQGRHLFSSLPRRPLSEAASRAASTTLLDAQLPYGMSITNVLPTTVPQKLARTPTLGELFPSPPTLPPLEAPKMAKTQTKGKVLGFHHPELAERPSYRHDKDSYFVKELSTGVWLDYSNAAPNSIHADRKRERALSLSGQKSSAPNPDISEMEALFRGAFSSFAPQKDDSGAVISSGEVGRVWYQRQGYRYMQELIGAEMSDDEDTNEIIITESEEQEIAKTLDNWDDSLLDPSLLGGAAAKKKSQQDKDVDDTLQEVSELIETLSSYQRNRLLTLPTNQNRNASDPTKVDMLNGSSVQEPSEEERDTYQMLKDQLALIIASLPPFAVARLNSDKLDELNVSTKIEVTSDVYKGVLEEDERAARLRQQQQQQQQQQQAAQAAQTPRQSSRPQTYHNGAPYQSSQPYNRQFQMPTQTPVPVPNHYQQSPVRNPMPPSYQRQVSAPMPGMQPQQHRPSTGQPFARPNGWNPQQSMQSLRNYSQGAVPTYQGNPGLQQQQQHQQQPPPPQQQQQQRVATNYQQHVQTGTPNRYPQGYPGYNPQQPQQPAMQPQYTQSPGTMPPHMNGTMPSRTMSPQVPQYAGAQGYSPRATQQVMGQARPYGNAGQPASHHPPGIPRFPSNGVQQQQTSPSPVPQPPQQQPTWAGQMSPEQRYQHQLAQRTQAIGRMTQFNEKMQQSHHAAAAGTHPGVAGLGGIGLGGAPMDYSKMVQMRASMPGAGGVGQASPSPRLPPASAVAPPPPGGMNGIPPQHMASPSPGPGPKPPTPV